MAFEIDQQTWPDLELFREEKGTRSVFSLFNKTTTKGGSNLLRDMLASPYADLTFLQEQQAHLPAN
jgi:DNA mismatch repair protein MutS